MDARQGDVQLDLFAGKRVGFDAAFSGLRRHELGLGAWVDHHPAWVSGHEVLFDQLSKELAWREETMKMYDREVTVPRLLASVPREGIVEEMRRALSERYGEEFVRTTAALYRDGKDSVAFHGDTTARDMLEAIVATVSLGQPRKFLLKPAEGGASVMFPAGRGDLIVMGGTCQRTWRHAIPKATHVAGPRIALMFRPSWGEGYGR
jgi:alkylated DNA repair dioxygenase AlkB